ncbi:MAG: hypothetical protein M1820_005112 [Bogoriella megaspora]|nr:MAG: hypothetical protein M1820_005112 [Bogoriella megaspora]
MASQSSRASTPASASTSPTGTSSSDSSVSTTSLLVLIAPSQTFNASVIDANAAQTTFLVNFPDSRALGPHNNATLTVGANGATAASGSYNYNAEISIPTTGMVTAGCQTNEQASPTHCVLTVHQGPLVLTSTTIPSNAFLPVTITAGLEKLSAASTVSPSGSATSSSATALAMPGAQAPLTGGGSGVGLVALLGMMLGRWFL